MKGRTLYLGSYAFALSGRRRETDDNTQGAASLCPGLCAGCPCGAHRIESLASKQQPEYSPRNVKSNFFRAKKFNIFYIFGREKFSTSSIRAPIKPRKFPLKHLENPLKHLENPRCFVLHPLYRAKKEEKAP